MVKSKLDDEIVYKEFKDINQTDKNSNVSLYQIVLFDKKVVICLGSLNNTYISKGILYCPVYIISDEKNNIEKIGLYEINVNDYTDILDEEGDINISILDGPLLFNHVNETYITNFIENNKVVIEDDLSDDDLKEDDGDDEIEQYDSKDNDDNDNENIVMETKKDNDKIKKNYVKKENEPWIQTWLTNNYYKIHDKGSGGDCFFFVT